MPEEALLRLLTQRLIYLLLGTICALWAVVPFDLQAGTLPGPDLFYCLTVVYVIRRPEWVPVGSVFFVFFLRDILTQAPLGLFTLLMILGTEVIRANIQAFREYIFSLEWLWVAAIYGLIMLFQYLFLLLLLTQAPRFLDLAYQTLFTILAYPVIITIMNYGFGFTCPRPGELDAWGKRL